MKEEDDMPFFETIKIFFLIIFFFFSVMIVFFFIISSIYGEHVWFGTHQAFFGNTEHWQIRNSE
ncbi:hypothetical protein IWQ51_004135 [Labrenzia sp. EL_142]|nr:hypothetical protein [Labrenzia sp. EL_142]